MKFTVTWLPDVEQEVAELWLQTSDRSALRDAADAVDQQLRSDPKQMGAGSLFFESTIMTAPCPS